MAPLWVNQLRDARRRGARLTSETQVREEAFREGRARVESATQRAERAAIILMQRNEDLARIVARRPLRGGY